jgi:aspartyl-tRNA(Asn)/glutamyl-tRNA(Gln) amidotransferase subunit B
MDYEIVIGLEVHAQLLTETKIFCGCRNKFTHEPNTNVCPVCLGQPGVLPVLNKKAFELGMKGALALNCEIPPRTKFDRKHYYYPDLPKNYQISQYDLPMSERGYLDINVDGVEKRIGITRAHLEEDAGKLMHSTDSSVVDLNRTGTPLLEIVSEPDMRSGAEAKAYLELLKLTLEYVGVSDCNMEEGSLRCDANISVRPFGQKELGTKNEIKNMNSFKGVEIALQLVAEKLFDATKKGEKIEQVTWGYSIEKQKIFKMRVKEEANDYRYFPEPDLPPVEVSREWVEQVRATLPELPRAKHTRFMDEYSLSDYDASVLMQDKPLAAYFEDVAKASGNPKDSANWVINDVAREMKERNISGISAFPVKPETLAELLALVKGNTINMPTARALFARLVQGETASPKDIVEKECLAQVSDSGALKEALEKIVAANPKQAAEIESGKHQTAMWFVGQIMKEMKGKADPQSVTQVIAERFGIDPGLLQKKK